MKLKKSLSIILLVGSLVAIPNCFNFSVRAVDTENDGFSTPVPHTNVEDIRRAMNSVHAVGPQLDAYYVRIKRLVKVIGDDGDISREKVHNDCMEEQLKMEFNITPQYKQSCYDKYKEYHSKLVASFFRIDKSKITQQNKKDFLNMCNVFLEVEEERMYDIIKNDIEYGDITMSQPKDMLKKIDESRKKRKRVDDIEIISKKFKF